MTYGYAFTTPMSAETLKFLGSNDCLSKRFIYLCSVDT